VDGSLAARIAANREAMVKNLARRKDPITGVSEFPNLQEKPLERPPLDREALAREAATRARERRGRVDTRELHDMVPGDGALARAAATAAVHGASFGELACAYASDAATIERLAKMRLADPFEALREASDRHAAATGAPPRIFLANLGPIAKYTARADFARNFFGTAGIESVDKGGFDDPAALAAGFRDSRQAPSSCSSPAIRAPTRRRTARPASTASSPSAATCWPPTARCWSAWE
jgi:methylmalonyl-CoA mutase